MKSIAYAVVGIIVDPFVLSDAVGEPMTYDDFDMNKIIGELKKIDPSFGVGRHTDNPYEVGDAVFVGITVRSMHNLPGFGPMTNLDVQVAKLKEWLHDNKIWHTEDSFGIYACCEECE